MALFGSKKKTETKTKKTAPKAEAKSAPAKGGVVHFAKEVIIRPRITEKAANATANNVYTFDVVITATKREVIEAVKTLYKVSPVKVNMVNTPAKKVRMRRKRGFGMVSASRKAYVFLKKGDTIEFSS